MIVVTTSGGVLALEVPGDPDTLEVRARDRGPLEALKGSVELAGHAAGLEYAMGEIEPLAGLWRLLVPKPTFAVWLQFEALNFTGYESLRGTLEEIHGAGAAESLSNGLLGLEGPAVPAGQGEAL